MMAENINISFMRSTFKRREGLHDLKLMIDEAHRLREEGRLRACSNKIADIYVTYRHLEPTSNEPIQEYMLWAYKYRRFIGEPYMFHRKEQRLADMTLLDDTLSVINDQIKIFEERLRRGLYLEATGKPVSFV
jgi:hypothetical protein